MCGSEARLCSATPCAASAAASSPYVSPAPQVTVAGPAVDDDVGRQAVERDELGRVGDVAERVARAQRVHARRARHDRAQLVERRRSVQRGGAVDVVAGPVGELPCQARPRARSMRRPRTRAPSARRALCSYSLVSHGRRPRMCGGGLLGEGALDVHVLGVDRGGDRHLVGGQAIGVVEARPLAGGEEVGRLAQRGQRAVAPRTSTGRRARRRRAVTSSSYSAGSRRSAAQRVEPPSAQHASWSTA